MDRNDLNFSDLFPEQNFSLPGVGCENSGHCIRQVEAAAIEYHVERKCDLEQIGGLLDSKGYGAALPPSKF